MAQVNDQDVLAIKEWLEQEPSLPTNFEDITLKKFIYSCHGSLERTKQCILSFCAGRRNMPEIYTDRDPMADKIKEAFDQTVVAPYRTEFDEVLVHKLTEFSDRFDFYSLLKSFSLQADAWLGLPRDVLPENHIVVLDIDHYPLMILTKINVFYFQKFILYLLDSMPVRLKEVHVINCPSFYEYMYSVVKTALPKSLCDMIHFHSDHKGLHQHFDKQYLPKDYGGDATTLADQSQFHINEIYECRKTLLDDDLWKAKANITKKDSIAAPMTGSFRKLAID